MSDSFRVDGPPEGTPLQFTAQLILNGSVYRSGCGIGCCSAGASGRILEGSSNAAEAFFSSPCGSTSISRTLEVQVNRLSGERFQVTVDLSAGGIEGSYAFIFGTLVFSNLPSGASVVSCNGFTQGVPVPVVRASWGQLKTAYR